jgi:DNA-binding CsgD family transcriptional regulator
MLAVPNPHHLSAANDEVPSLLVAASCFDPGYFSRFISEAWIDDVVFFAYDFSYKINYLSKNAESLLNIRRDWWLNHSIWDVLSSNPINEAFRHFEYQESLEPATIPGAKGRCEIVDQYGKRTELSFCRAHILKDDLPIGVAGVLRIVQASQACQKANTFDIPYADLRQRVESLTAVEREVVELVTAGHLNKNIASKLNVAVRTIETRRSRMMLKLRVRSVPELVRLWIQVQDAGL